MRPKMKLGNKTFIYSATVAGVVAISLIAYYIFLIPNLFVSYGRDIHIDYMKSFQHQIATTGTIKDAEFTYPYYSIKYQLKTDEIELFSSFGTLQAKVNESKILSLLENIYESIQTGENDQWLKDDNRFSEDFNQIFETVFKDNDTFNITNHKMNIVENNTTEQQFIQLKEKESYLFEFLFKQGDMTYINAVGVLAKDNILWLSIAPNALPMIKEIQPIILNSLPTIIVFIILIILIGSYYFSRKLVKPIEQLKKQAKSLSIDPSQFIKIDIDGSDELSDLGQTLNELHAQLLMNLNQLQVQYNQMQLSQKRQQQFIQASSHQLKTPTASAILLVEGMIDEIGKYKDTKTYLPILKERLLKINDITFEILSLENNEDFLIKKETIQIDEMVKMILDDYQSMIQSKSLNVLVNAPTYQIQTNPAMILKVIETIINNAIKYTPNHHTIHINLINNQLIIENSGVTIDEKHLPYLFDPFYRARVDNDGHGIGLYIVKSYAEQLGIAISVQNKDESVEVIIDFKDSSNH